jgi:hypothetical protein
VADALTTTGMFDLDDLRLEPVWTGSAEKYHMYLRSQDRRIGFAGTDSGVPARPRENGTTLLDDVWAAPVPRTRQEFLDRVLDTVRQGRRDALLTHSEARRVLGAAASADIDASGRAHAHLILTSGEPLPPTPPTGDAWVGEASLPASGGWTVHPARSGDTQTEVVVWILDDEDDGIAPPPAVEITATPAPATSGWFTARPTIDIRGTDIASDGAEVALDVRVGDSDWHPYDRPFALHGEGEVTVSVRATTSDGAVGSASRTFAIDTMPPESRATVTPLGSSVEISFAATDQVSGVERIQWEGDGTFWATFQEAFVRALTDREQIIEFAATDRAGNEEARQRLILPPAPTP